MDKDPGIHVSYILGTMNRSPFLDKVLKNIREFIKPDDELIVMDGGSTDDTFDVVGKHRDIIALFESEKDSGPAHAYNKALLKSRGSLIVNINDDDYFYPEGVLCAAKVMDDHPEIDALICGGEIVEYNPKTQTNEFVRYHYLPDKASLTSDMKNFMYYATHGFLILRKKTIAIAGIFDTTFQAVDTDYMSRLFLCGANFKYFNVKMFRHTEYLHSHRQKNRSRGHLDSIRIFLRHGEWGPLLQFEWSEVEQALGLNDNQYKSYSKIVYRLVIKIGFFCMKSVDCVIGAFKMIIRFRKKQEQTGIKEPEWDASLR